MLEPSSSAKKSDETSVAAPADGTPTGGDRKQMKNRLPDLVPGDHGGDVKAGSSPGEGIGRPKEKKNCPSDLLRSPKRSSRSDSPPSNTDGEAQATGEGPAAPSRKKRSKRMVDKDQLKEHRTSVSFDVKASLHGSPGEGTPRPEQIQPDQPSTHGDGEASADADKGKHMLINKDHTTEETFLIGNIQEQGAEQMQGLLDLDYDEYLEQANYFFTSLSIDPPMGEDYWTEYDKLQLNEVYERLALFRIKDYELLSTGKELDIAELKVKYPPSVLRENYYFKHYEETLEWYFHPEHCKMAGLADYQRLVLHDDGRYGDWDYYRLTHHTYQGDLEYVQYCDEMSKEIKWIEDKVGLDKKQWHDCRAYLQALKIATKYRNIFRHSVCSAYLDYTCTMKLDFKTHRDFDGVYLEIWKRVAKQKMDFHDALAEVYKQNMFPLRKFDIKRELKKNLSKFRTSMKKNYDTYVACIDEKISEEEAHLIIIEAVKKMIPMQKTHLDYVKKKLEIATRIGLVPKRAV